MESALYLGKVGHARHIPKHHSFSYKIFLFWLDLDEINALEQQVSGFSTKRWSPVRFHRGDYLDNTSVSLKQNALQRMSALAGRELSGKVFMLGQLRMWGWYFSPVNFYYLRQDNGQFSHMLAEVSNTPWNERHCYLVDLAKQQDCPKAFHVSPFNPMDMTYRWQVSQPGEKLTLSLSCIKENKHFDANLDLNKRELNSNTLFNVLLSIPSMVIKTVAGIYWQALKLFIKGMPIYSHPKARGKKHNER
jgi:uncharacterized protein